MNKASVKTALSAIQVPLILTVLSMSLCTVSLASQPLYLDAKQPVDQRLDDLLSRMTLEEKVGQMCQYVGIEHTKRLNYYRELGLANLIKLTEDGMIGSFLHVVTLKESNYLQELAQKSRLKIPLLIGIDAIHGDALVSGTTVYPTPLSLAGTWDTELVERIGRQTALEMRATGSQWTFTPNLDIARDARWGRVGETFGEDTYLVSQMGVAMIRGLQQTDFTGPDKVIACAKHLAAGSEPVNGLNVAPMDVSVRTLREVFLPPYKKAIDAGVFTLMAAHHDLNGVPCHANTFLLTDLLRKEWGFDGFVVSDWMDIEGLIDVQRVAENQKEACFLSVDAGIDMHMHGPDFLEPVVELVREGRLSEDRINFAARRILEAKFKLGLFENPIVDEKKTQEIVMCQTHQDTALEAARKGIILLKNENLLPLDTKKYKKILVTGPAADTPIILGDWAYEQPEENVITVAEGFKQAAPAGCEVNYFDCGRSVRKIETEAIKKAAQLANESDVVVLVVGCNSLRYMWDKKTGGENSARANINLPGNQMELVQSLYQAGKPVIVILVSGRPLAEPWIAQNIPAIVEAWEPGSKAGQALAEIVFGKVNPSGKLPISIPYSVGQIQTIYNHKPSQYNMQYVLEPTGPLYEFGYGLTYTTYAYSDLKLDKETILAPDQYARVSVDVQNTGDRPGDEIVQLYIQDLFSQVTRPVKELKAFRRIHLEPGQKQTLEFAITPEMLAYYNLNMDYVVEPGEFKISVGSSSREQDLQTVILTVQ